METGYCAFRPRAKDTFCQGTVHSIEHDFPLDLVNLLEEWLWKWRPITSTGPEADQKGNECCKNEQEFVFLNMSAGRLLPSE